MLFNSFEFAAFFAVFYLLYLMLFRWRRAQNMLLLVASYVFYGWWDWRFLSLLALSTVVDFSVGRALTRTDDSAERKRLVTISVVVNLAVLGFFKYFNFFVGSFTDAMASVGWTVDALTLDIVLPVGISFYTFQTLSYSIDVYRKKMPAARSLLDFAVFVAFFPQLVAGPIERAARFLPQVQQPRKLSTGQWEAGLYLVVWGLWKKIVLADNAALIANRVFNDHTSYEGLDLLAGALAFTLQIYGDFSGYSDIARGLAKWLGFDLMLNFRLPYFARDPSDFWERWHISLSSWLRDYLYIPLGGNRGGKVFTWRNLALTMLLGGLWHGARWNFVIWGAFHGAILILYRIVRPKRGADPPGIKGWARAGGEWAVMSVFTVVGWIIFRAETASQIGYFFAHMGPSTSAVTGELFRQLAILWTPLWLVQIWQHRTRDLLCFAKAPAPVGFVFLSLCVLTSFLYGVQESIEFIYFQF